MKAKVSACNPEGSRQQHQVFSANVDQSFVLLKSDIVTY